MNMTIITVLESGEHLRHFKEVPDYRAAVALPQVRGPEHAADVLALFHMAKQRKEHAVAKFVVIRGSDVLVLDPDGLPLS